MAKYSSLTVQGIVDDFAKGREAMNGMSVEILPNENQVDALLLLRTYNSEKTTEDMIPLVQSFCRGRTIRVMQGDTELTSIVYDGTAPLQTVFAAQPWILDLLINCCYAIMLKKLTPPSIVLEKASPVGEVNQQSNSK